MQAAKPRFRMFLLSGNRKAGALAALAAWAPETCCLRCLGRGGYKENEDRSSVRAFRSIDVRLVDDW